MTITEDQGTTEDLEPEVQYQYEFKTYIPQGFKGEPQTPVEVLLRAQSALQDEARWVKQEWYRNDHPEVDPDDPFCNDWKACASGMVALVSIGSARTLSNVKYDPTACKYVLNAVPKDQQRWRLLLESEGYRSPEPPNKELYDAANAFLLEGIRETSLQQQIGFGLRFWSSVPEFNDSYLTTREDVLRAFSFAIVAAAKAEATSKVATVLRDKLEGMIASA